MSVHPKVKGSIVIIGGGVSGRTVAKLLIADSRNNASVTIIQQHNYAFSPTLQPYWLANPNKIDKCWDTKKGTVANINKVSIPGVKYAFGSVSAIDTASKTITLEEGGQIHYDVVCIATGVHYPLITPSADIDSVEKLKQNYKSTLPQKIGAADSILIGGAGPVACEMATTIRSLNPTCKITMVSSGNTAIPQWTGTAARKVSAYLKKMKIELIKNEKLLETSSSMEKGVYTLVSSGKTVEADIYLPYFGAVATNFMPKGTTEDRSGRILVNKQAQSITHPELFAVGCSDRVRMSFFDNIAMEAKVVAKNTVALLNGKDLPSSLKPKAVDLGYMHFRLGEYTIINPKPFPVEVCCTLMGCPLCFFCPCCAACGWNGCFPASKIGSQFMETMVVGMNGAPGNKDFKAMHATESPLPAAMTR
jgi:NADH dehydrogenase FAD-containing subunit